MAVDFEQNMGSYLRFYWWMYQTPREKVLFHKNNKFWEMHLIFRLNFFILLAASNVG